MVEKPLNILFVTNNYTPYSGGVVSSINAIAQELMQQGHRVTIVSLDFLGDGHDDDPSHVRRITCPIKFRYKKNCMAIPWRTNEQLMAHVTDIQPDIIHAHHPWLLGSAALRVACAAHIPIIFTYHTLYEHYAHYVPLPQFITRIVIRWLVKRYCESVDGVIAPSVAVRAYLDRLVPPVPVIILPSPIAHDFFEPDRSIRGIQRPRQVFRLLYVGRLVQEKNIQVLIDLIAMLSRTKSIIFTLTLVGYGEYRKQLEDYAYRVVGLSHEVIMFLGKQERKSLVMLYERYDVFVFSSQSDTQGLVLAEAMACGLPVVALDGPGQRDIIEHEKNGFLVRSLEDMSKKIQYLANNNNLYRCLSDHARRTAARYAPYHITHSLLNTYHAIVAVKAHSRKGNSLL
ncbi:MAG: glycosyltransferase [Anaerolineales bacterium]|nr:glycosyltransferase [Anaerolineales bacterium]